MKIFLAAFLFPLLARAEAPYFTTVFHDDEAVVYVGVKKGEGDATIVTLPFHSGDRNVIPLPEAISKRDVIGLINQKEKLFVITSGGDGPMLHVYNRLKNEWTKLGQVKCPSFTKARLTSTRITFSCEVGKSKRGKTRVSPKSISYGKLRLYRHGVWRFPEFLLRHKGRVAVLEGPAPHWDKLRLRSADSERTISASDLLQIPLPPPPKP